jgi:hypothetical protein
LSEENLGPAPVAVCFVDIRPHHRQTQAHQRPKKNNSSSSSNNNNTNNNDSGKIQKKAELTG